VRGDLDGTATLCLGEAPDGTEVTLAWEVRLAHPVLRVVEPLARPLLVWGHNWVVDEGIEAFAAHHGARGPIVVSDTDGSRFDAVAPLDLLVAAGVAAVVSGAPSTVHALLTGRSALSAARAAGSLLGRPILIRGVAAHAAVSLLWTLVLARFLRRRSPGSSALEGAAAGVAIAALDLGVVGRAIPSIRSLPTGPQVADHALFGATVGAVLAYTSGAESRGQGGSR
jgi:hypothetical protein